MIEIYLLGIATGFFIGVAVAIVPEMAKKRKGEYIELKRRQG